MHIAQIVPSLEARHGGPSVSVPALASSLAHLGHSVSLLSTGARPDHVDDDPRLIVRTFPRNRPASICPSPGLRKYLHHFTGDVIHSHGLWLRTLHYAHRETQRRKIPHVISPRGMMADWAWNHHRGRKAYADRFIHPGALHLARGWHATSRSEAEDIRARGYRQPICLAPNGVNAPSPGELKDAAAYWQRACPEAFQRRTALFHSRLHPKKRVLELIDLWLEQAPPDWLLLVVGIPETYTVAQLADYVQRERGSDRVRIFDGTETPPPYVAASLFLLPSHSENFGLVVAEALAHGLPVAVTNTTPWEPLQRAGLGWCVAWDDFGRALQDALAETPDRLRQRGAEAGRWVLAEYSWEKSARLLADFYAQLKEDGP
ncbi:MAG TPA: glycosyltransferase [Opitutaceae bacterium]|nr:glycosyltransferase [Opitutaceae bacterium]